MSLSAFLFASQYFAFKWEPTHTRTKSPIKVQWSPFLVQLKNVLKGETPQRSEGEPEAPAGASVPERFRRFEAE